MIVMYVHIFSSPDRSRTEAMEILFVAESDNTAQVFESEMQ